MSETLPPIVLEIVAAVPAADAWTVLTDPARVADWLTDVTPLGAVGDPYRLDFGDGSIVDGVVQLVEPGHRFAHTWAWLDVSPRQETVVTWTVESLEAGGTRITLIHDGWSEADADEAIRDDHEGYWSGYLDDLAAILAESS